MEASIRAVIWELNRESIPDHVHYPEYKTLVNSLRGSSWFSLKERHHHVFLEDSSRPLTAFIYTLGLVWMGEIVICTCRVRDVNWGVLGGAVRWNMLALLEWHLKTTLMTGRVSYRALLPEPWSKVDIKRMRFSKTKGDSWGCLFLRMAKLWTLLTSGLALH